MDYSSTDMDSDRSMFGAPMSFSLPQVICSNTPDMSVTVSLNTTSGQHTKPPQYQHKHPYTKRPSGNYHGTLLQLLPQYGAINPFSKEPDVSIAEWNNSGASGVQPNIPFSATQATDTASGAPTYEHVQVSASSGSHGDAPHHNPIVSNASSESSAAVAAEKDRATDLIHLLVVFDKMFCVCFVPPGLRASLKVGELVLCECPRGENIGTIVADVSALIAEVIQHSRRSMVSSTVEEIFFPPAERAVNTAETTTPSVGSSPSGGSFIPTTSLNAEKVCSGLATDQWLRRLPCVLRRGTNRDKKRVYFARLRSNDALAAVHRILRSEPLVAHSAEYQVNFASVTIYLTGERTHCPWSDFQFQQLGNTLIDPMRSETVEFRFVSDQHHEELDLTRFITGVGLSEVLFAAVAEHHERQSVKSGAGGRGGGSHGSASNRSSQLVHQVHQQPQTEQLFSSQSENATSHTNSVLWPQSMTPPSRGSYATPSSPQQQQQQAMRYTLPPCLYVSQQQQAPPNIHNIPFSGNTIHHPQSNTHPLSLVQVHYPSQGQLNATPALYWANVSAPPHTQQLETPQQSPPLSIVPGTMAESPFYCVVNSTQQQQQQQILAPPPPSASYGGMTFLQAATLPTSSPVQQPTFVQVPIMNAENYPAVSYPLFSSNATPYS